jgi:N-acetylneuraminic acid mutarotase
MGVPRSETAAAVVDGLIYVPGGFDDESDNSNVLEVYDPAADHWRQLAAMPQPRNHPMVAAYHGRVYVFGGAADSRTPRTTTAWAYDPAADTWSSLAPMPETRVAGAGVTLGDFLYVIGGVGDTVDLLRYDPKANKWKRLAPLHEQREHVAGVALGGKLYAIGGRWGAGGELKTVAVYDPTANAWTETTPMLEVRAGGAAVIVQGRIFVAGGELIYQNTAGTLRSVEIYDPSTGVWQDATPMPVGLHGIPMASVSGKVYILGGSEAGGGINNQGRVLIYQMG